MRIITPLLLSLGLTLNAGTFEQTPTGVKTIVDGTSVELQFYTPSVVRVIKSPEGNTFEKSSLSIIANPETIKRVFHNKC